MKALRFVLVYILFVNAAASAQDSGSEGLRLSDDRGIWQTKHSPALDLTNEITLEATVFFDKEQPAGGRIIDKLQSNNGSGGFALGIAKDHKLWMVAGQQHMISNQRH